MTDKKIRTQHDRKEIPVRPDPGRVTPEKAPNPDLEPGRDNPVNPQTDEVKGC